VELLDYGTSGLSGTDKEPWAIKGTSGLSVELELSGTSWIKWNITDKVPYIGSISNINLGSFSDIKLFLEVVLHWPNG
jgi:hypothetical protein